MAHGRVPMASNFRILIVLHFGRCLQGPESRNHLLANVQAAVADRRQQPFMQAHPIGVAPKIPQLEWKMPEGVGAVDDSDNPPRASQAADPCQRKHLGRQVGDVAEMENFRLRRDGLLEPVVEIVPRRWDGELKACYLDAVAPHALVPSGPHAGVVLLRGDHFVPCFQIDPILSDWQRLAGATRQRHLLRVTSALRGQAQPYCLNAIGNRTLLKNRGRVDHVHVAPFRFQSDSRRRAGKTVIQVDDRAL